MRPWRKRLGRTAYGVGSYVDQNGNTNDLSTVPVVGKFLGAQMSATRHDHADWTD